MGACLFWLSAVAATALLLSVGLLEGLLSAVCLQKHGAALTSCGSRVLSVHYFLFNGLPALCQGCCPSTLCALIYSAVMQVRHVGWQLITCQQNRVTDTGSL
jgi:hypothetical protein